MDQLFPEIEISADQAEAIARGLLAIARADGEVHPAEEALIGEFYGFVGDEEEGGDRYFDRNALMREGSIDGAVLAQMLPGADLREAFIRTGLLLAWADGDYSAGERKVLEDYATALELGVDALDLMQTQVKEHMLRQLSHLNNVEAVAEVAKELDV